MKSSYITALITSATSIAFACAPAFADLRVAFIEGAPKDRFVVENTSACELSGTLTIDIGASSAGLIFDVTSTGAGVEVFQPIEIVSGANALASVPEVVDGQSKVELSMTRLAPNATIAFTIDVDDTLGQRAITVSGSEIAGAAVTYNDGMINETAVFSSKARASLPLKGCQPAT
ncbi:MAG: aggregation factor core [Pseudomonadota bacterium]